MSASRRSPRERSPPPRSRSAPGDFSQRRRTEERHERNRHLFAKERVKYLRMLDADARADAQHYVTVSWPKGVAPTSATITWPTDGQQKLTVTTHSYKKESREDPPSVVRGSRSRSPLRLSPDVTMPIPACSADSASVVGFEESLPVMEEHLLQLLPQPVVSYAASLQLLSQDVAAHQN